MDKLAVLIGAALLTGFIVWWFFAKHKTTETQAALHNSSQEVEIVVDGGYTPNTVVLKRDVPAKLTFNRRDASGCFNEVVFPDFGISQKLPVDERYSIDINTSDSGEYQYACGMNMFHGKVVIK